MVIGKNRIQFEKWYVRDFLNNKKAHKESIRYETLINRFDNLPFEMQIGVYLAYYDSLGIEITVVCMFEKWKYKIIRIDTIKYKVYSFREAGLESRNEAYKEAFKQADKLINKLN
jgi:hypothetical protein